MIIVGIDSGQTGGIAAVGPDGGLLGTLRMPLIVIKKKQAFDLRAAHKWLHTVTTIHAGAPLEFVIEQVWAMPKQGVSSSFQFGRMYGGVEAWAVGTGMPVHHVTAAVWKKALGLTSNKQQSLDMARLKFGDSPLWAVKRNDGIAEAALLADYWRGKM